MSCTLLECMRAQISSVHSLDRLSRRGDTREDSAEILFQSYLREAIVSSPGKGRGVPLLDFVRSEFLLPATASPTLQGALKECFEQPVVALPVLCVYLVLIRLFQTQ